MKRESAGGGLQAMKAAVKIMCVAIGGLFLWGGCKPSDSPQGSSSAPAPAIQQAIVVFEGVAPEDEVVLKDLLRVDGVLVQGTQYICSINGQICNVGENLKLSAKTRTYNLKLIAISGDRVLLSAVEGR